MHTDFVEPGSLGQSRPIPNIDKLAALFIHAFPQLNVEERKLTLKLYEMLADGDPVPHIRLAKALGGSPESVSNTLNQWPGVFYDEAGEIVGFWGLSVKNTRHRLTVNGKTSYAWCAWDTLFIPELLNASVKIVSTCTASGAEIRLTVSPAGIGAVDPDDVVLSFLAPDESELREDVTTNFCHFVQFFRSRIDAEVWVSEHEGTFLLSLDDAFMLGKKVNAARYGHDLEI
jgi:alkylmercury lyase